MKTSTKILFVGLDSSEPDLLWRWMGTGVLPTLRSLKETGAWAHFSNFPGFGNGTLWPSLFAGVNPGVHGRYFHLQYQKDSYQTRKFIDEDFGNESIWSVLSRAGKKVAAIDIVRAPLYRDLNGMQLVDCMTHDPQSSRVKTWPPELGAEVKALFGTNPMRKWEGASRNPAKAHKVLRDILMDRVSIKTDLSCHYLEQGGWDLFMTSFGEPHDVGHEQWHLHDPSHPQHDPDWRRQYGDPVEDIYVAVDKAIARLMKSAGRDAITFVVAGPGIGPNYTASYMLDEILHRLDPSMPTSGSSLRGAVKSIYRAILPGSLRGRLRRVAGQVDDTMLATNRRNQKVFALPNSDNAGAIRINLIGRDPDGRVQPGAECDALCEMLKQDLMEIINLETGKPLVEKVVRVADHCHGARLDDLPDLFVVWRRDGPIGAIRSPKIGTIDEPYLGTRTGDHTMKCVMFARGRSITPGKLRDAPSVLDLAPTMAELLGESLPAAEGHPIGHLRRAARAGASATTA